MVMVDDEKLKHNRLALLKEIATGDYRRSIALNLSNVYKGRGNEALKAKDFPEAFTQYQNALKYDPGNLSLLRNVSMIALRDLQDTTRAVTYLSEYIRLNPSDTTAPKLLRNLTEE